MIALAFTVASARAENLSETRLLPENGFFGANDDGIPYLYGQINKGFLAHSDGQDTNFFPLVDNDNSSTRVGIKYEAKWWPNVTIYGNIEGEWQPYASNSVNQLNKGDIDWGDANLRKFELQVEIDDFGRLWAGQGAMASDSSAEADLSGTTLIAYSSIADTAGGQLFAFDGGRGGLSGVSIGDAYSNLDGLSRRMRLRYDTPSFGGARVSSSVGYDALGGDDVAEWDIAASFGRNEDGESFAFAAAAAYSRPKGVDDRFSASASVLLKPTGLSLTVAGGYDAQENNARDPAYFYGKLGYSPPWLTSLGRTSFAVDVYYGQDFNTLNSDSLSFAFAAVQSIVYSDTSFDLYGIVRHHAYDDPGANYEDGLSFMTGIRWKF